MSQQNIEALRGLQEAFNAGDLEAALEVFDPQADEAIAMAERVFVWVRITGHGRSSGVEVALEEAYVYTFRDGIIVRLEEYFDRQEGLRAAGIAG